MTEKVNHPSHYNQGPLEEDGTAKYEVIKVIERLGWGFPFCMGNALKYLLRAKHKGNEAEDLEKAEWYLRRACTYPQEHRALDSTFAAEVVRAWRTGKAEDAYIDVAVMDMLTAEQPELVLEVLLQRKKVQNAQR